MKTETKFNSNFSVSHKHTQLERQSRGIATAFFENTKKHQNVNASQRKREK